MVRELQENHLVPLGRREPCHPPGVGDGSEFAGCIRESWFRPDHTNRQALNASTRQDCRDGATSKPGGLAIFHKDWPFPPQLWRMRENTATHRPTLSKRCLRVASSGDTVLRSPLNGKHFTPKSQRRRHPMCT